MKAVKIAAVLAVLAAAGGCTQVDNSGYEKESSAGRDFVTSDPSKISNDRGQDFNEQPSDQLLNTPYSNSNVVQSTGEEIGKVRYVIKKETKYKADNVWVNGRTITVSINSKGKVHSEEEQKKEGKRISRLLKNAIPRYDFKVHWE